MTLADTAPMAGETAADRFPAKDDPYMALDVFGRSGQLVIIVDCPQAQLLCLVVDPEFTPSKLGGEAFRSIDVREERGGV